MHIFPIKTPLNIEFGHNRFLKILRTIFDMNHSKPRVVFNIYLLHPYLYHNSAIHLLFNSCHSVQTRTSDLCPTIRFLSYRCF